VSCFRHFVCSLGFACCFLCRLASVRMHPRPLPTICVRIRIDQRSRCACVCWSAATATRRTRPSGSWTT
jgi:hypothetical protein